MMRRRLTARFADAMLEATVVGSFSSTGVRVRRVLDRWDPLREAAIGRHILVTGANRGLGLATAAALLERGGRVTVTGRDPQRAHAAREAAVAAALARTPTADPEELRTRTMAAELDLSRLDSVRELATRLIDGPPIDVVVQNAGAMYPTKGFTDDGLERTYQTHVAAPFLLTALLLPRLAAQDDPRVITVSSGGMYTERLIVARVDSPGGYRPAVAYARAKRAQVELNVEFHRRLAARTGIAFHAMHPGWAATDGLAESLPGFHRTMRPLLRTPAEAIDTVVFLALVARHGPGLHGGGFWHDRRPRRSDRLPRTACGPDEREALWDRLVAETGCDPCAIIEARP